MKDIGPSGMLSVADQTISGNMVVVSSVTLGKDGWVVIHKDNGEGPLVPAIIAEPKYLEAGSSENIMIEIKEGTPLNDGEKLWVMLHTDDGSIGTYEFDGASGLDGPIMREGNITMQQITLHAPEVMAMNQAIVNNTVTIAKVEAAADGWLVIHNDNGNGQPVLPGIIGKTWVEAGVNENVVVELDDANTYTVGQKLFPMLHVDSPADMEYTFPDNEDVPEVFGFEENNIIMISLSVTE
jgi:hypothetical protein